MNPFSILGGKLFAVALVIACVALAGAGVLLKRQIAATARAHAEIVALQAANSSLVAAREADGRAIQRLRQNNAATARADASARQSLSAAKLAEPSWAETPVPQSVREALIDTPPSPDPAGDPAPGLVRRGDAGDNDSPATGRSDGSLPSPDSDPGDQRDAR
jgi:type II secretory pathway pseudopilin PulG